MVARAGPSGRLRIAVVAGGVAAVLVFVGLACGPGDLSDLTRGRADAGPKADLCPSRATAPAPPPASAEGPSLPEIVFAADDLRVDTGEFDAGLPKPQGLDLDHSCGCGVEPPSCKAPADAGAPACKSPPDGRDNVAGPLLGDLATLVTGLKPNFLQDRVRGGIFSILFSIQEWNGNDNDPHVLFMIRMSPGLNDGFSQGGTVSPRFDGNDVWDVDPGSILQGSGLAGQDCSKQPCVGKADTAAYVSGGTLVAHLAALPLVIASASGALTLPFVGATVTAKLTNVGGTRRLVGELAGRMPATTLLAATSALEDPLTKQSLCADPQTYALYKQSLCGVLDLAADPANDNSATPVPCGAVSEAVGFSSVAAKLGIVRGVIQPISNCANVTDSCPGVTP